MGCLVPTRAKWKESPPKWEGNSLMDRKKRRPFVLLDSEGETLGRGVCYNEGNVQVYIGESPAAWQMRLQDVLYLKDVAVFRWSERDDASRH